MNIPGLLSYISWEPLSYTSPAVGEGLAMPCINLAPVCSWDTSHHCRALLGCSPGPQSPGGAVVNPAAWIPSPAHLPTLSSICGAEGCSGLYVGSVLAVPSLLPPKPSLALVSAQPQSNRGGSPDGFILIDFVRSCCILLHGDSGITLNV